MRHLGALLGILSMCTTLLIGEVSLENYLEEGRSFGKRENSMAIDQMKEVSLEEFQPKIESSFDSNKARDQLHVGQQIHTELGSYLNSEEMVNSYQTINKDEYFFRRSEGITAQNEIASPNGKQIQDYTFEKCLEAEGRSIVSMIRTLELEKKMVTKTEKICSGHSEQELLEGGSKSTAKKWIKRKKEKLDKDSSIESSDAFILDHERGEYYLMKATWRHFPNSPQCDCYTLKEVIEEVADDYGEHWVYENSHEINVTENPDLRLIEKVCLDEKLRIIKGKEVKKCWKEKLIYLATKAQSNKCSFLNEKDCQEVSRHCVKEDNSGCALWEVTYKCFPIQTKKVKQENLENFGDMGDWEKDYKPNNSFSNVASKLKVFEEMKHDMEKQNAKDASTIEIFSGKKMSCSKSVADDLLYDCCFAFGGLAKDLKLSQCNEEEISLAEMREKGLCHYVGKRAKEFLGMWKSRDEHVFCCFSSKLSRVFLEQARSQLDKDWGSAKSPNCEGLLFEEINKLDFEKIDLSEIYDKPSADFEKRLQQKIENIQPKIKSRVENEAKLTSI